MTNYGLIGPAGSGKDTVGRILTESYGYVRVSFADPVREVLLGMDPPVRMPHWLHGEPLTETRLLSDLVAAVGWERAKREVNDVRRMLVGHAMACRRILGEDVWCDLGLRTAAEHNAAGRPVVFTDVRFANEAEGILRMGGSVVEIHRPGVDYGPDDADQEAARVAARHATGWLLNDGLIEDLREVFATALGEPR